MKIKTIDSSTKQPTKNQRIQLQIKGKDSGYLTVTTDAQGYFTIDEKYKGQQFAIAGTTNYIGAADGATLYYTNGQYAGGKTGGQGQHTGSKEKNKETWK